MFHQDLPNEPPRLYICAGGIFVDEKNLVSREQLRNELESFRKFAFSENLAALAISLTMASATQKVVSSISDCLMMPLINYAVASAEGNWRNLVFVPAEGLSIELGRLTGVFMEFVFTSLLAYILYEKLIKRLQSGRGDGQNCVGSGESKTDAGKQGQGR